MISMLLVVTAAGNCWDNTFCRTGEFLRADIDWQPQCIGIQ